MGTFCDPSLQLCQIEFTQPIEDSCVADSYACVPGAVCDNATQKCVAAAESSNKCSSDADCGNSRCLCLGNGESHCEDTRIAVCSQQLKDWRGCLGDNHCLPSYFPGSCAYTQCATAWTELTNCQCDEYKSMYGSGCLYQQCTLSIHFEFWQILIIIFVCILALGLVIFIGVAVVRHCTSGNPYSSIKEEELASQRRKAEEIEAEEDKEESLVK